MLFVPFSDLDEEIRPGCGLWSREQLEEMNARFVIAVTAAFDRGLENRAAAAAVVRVKSREEAIEAAIQQAWEWLWGKNGDVSCVEVVEFVRARCPGVTVARVRAGFDLRWKSRQASAGRGAVQSV